MAQVLEGGLKGSSAESVLKDLTTLLETANTGTALQHELVKVICAWSCSTPRLNMALAAHALEKSRCVPSPASQSIKREAEPRMTISTLSRQLGCAATFL